MRGAWNLLFVATAVGLPLSTALAQGQSNNTSVRERGRPEFDAVGVPFGAYRAFPVLELGAVHNSNVFATEAAEESDTSYSLDTSVNLVSDWGRHALDFNLGSSSLFYSDLDDQNVTNLTAGADAQLDIVRGAFLTGSVQYLDGAEALAQSPTVGLVEPIDYNTLSAELGAVVEGVRTRLTTRVGLSESDYDDGVLFDGSAQDQDFRDTTTIDASARVDLAVTADTAVYVEAGFNTRDADLDPPQVFANRDSDGYEILAGAAFDITNLVRGDVGVGFFSQSFDQAGVAEVEELAVRGLVEWFPSPLFTVALEAERGVGDAGLGGAAGSIVSEFGVSADYEVLVNAILNGGISYREDDYQGFDRTDSVWAVNLGGEYLINRAAAIYAGYSYADQSSDGTGPGREYEQSIFRVGLRLQR